MALARDGHPDLDDARADSGWPEGHLMKAGFAIYFYGALRRHITVTQVLESLGRLLRLSVGF